MKIRKLSKEELKQQLIDSFIINSDKIETEELNDKAIKIRGCCHHYKNYEELIRRKKKNIVCIAYHQGKVFRRLKEKGKFIKLVNEFNIHNKNTMIFKINIAKLIGKHPKLMRSSVTLGFLKNYYKYIKQICNENSNKL